MNFETNYCFGRRFSKNEEYVRDFMEEHSFLFDDMLFKAGSKTYQMIELEYEDGTKDDDFLLPDSFIGFGYEYVDVKVEPLEDCGGYYDKERQELAIDEDNMKDSVILHEMIHLHEDLLLDESPYFRDVLFFELYKSLSMKIPKLNELIEGHGHLSTMVRFNGSGLHSLVFLLKSFEIDIYNSWKLGTTFSYGYAESLKDYEYIK